VIPLFVKKFINHESPEINGDGTFSRDFTYVDNVILMNLLSITTENENALNQIYNTAVGDRTTLVQLTELIKKHLAVYDQSISKVEIVHRENRIGDIPHSLASVQKAYNLLGYQASHTIDKGIEEAIRWYWEKI
jgi:UDP-N-acetylglucosamine 4-epimerase